MPGTAAGLGVELGIKARPVPPGTRRPSSATVAGSQSGKHVPCRGCEDVCRAPRAQRGEPASVPASCQAATSRPPSGDVTSSTLPCRGHRGSWSPPAPRPYLPGHRQPGRAVQPCNPPASSWPCPVGQVSAKHLTGGGLSGGSGAGGRHVGGGRSLSPLEQQGCHFITLPSQGRAEPTWAPQRHTICQHPCQAAPRGASAPAWEHPRVPVPPLRGGRRGSGSAEGGGPGGACASCRSPAQPRSASRRPVPLGRGPRNQQKDK